MDNGGRFVDVRILDIVENIIYPNVLAANSKVTHLCYNRVGKIRMKYRDVHPFLCNLSKDTPVARAFGVTHHNDPRVYLSSK